MDKHLIDIEDFQTLGRPMSRHLDEGEVMAFVSEGEDLFIVPAIGIDCYNRLASGDLSEDDNTLLNGDEWSDGAQKHVCRGLKRALVYYAYAKMAMADGSVLTRSGSVQHNDSYAERADDKNRVRRYNEVMNIAEEYLNGCLLYIRHLQGEKGHVCKVRGSRLRINAIGE